MFIRNHVGAIINTENFTAIVPAQIEVPYQGSVDNMGRRKVWAAIMQTGTKDILINELKTETGARSFVDWLFTELFEKETLKNSIIDVNQFSEPGGQKIVSINKKII